ncbi:MAG: alpha-ribazole phosphatase [Nitrospinaceae bacterium]|jgi:alpha-ribazole phosphatase|nr:alpha-ribazole phosphatase [Nitrospina sp.]MBT5377118.1 alpha-ribazole phosphatase [Nitrospinaceae bacterium]MBT6346065.1 alpha-ribazole phosphatase [Nitrospina sp.]
MNEKPSCRVYLFRHGETANSKEVCFNGHFDVGLSAKGESQFRDWAENLKEEPFKAIYSSDLARTRMGAEKLAERHQLKLVSYPELRELCFGEWEGLSITEVEEKYPNQLTERMKNIEAFHVQGGETFQQLQERVIPKFEEIIARHPDEQIALVCHGGVNRVILAHLLEIPMKRIFRIKQDYAALNIIQYYGDEPVVELLGAASCDRGNAATPNKKIPIQ